MYIVPLSSNITPLQPLESIIPSEEPAQQTEEASEPTFLDAMTALWDNAAQAQAVKTEDMMNLMLGDTDSLEQLQINITKAELATQLLVNVKNAAVDAYNEIMRMSI